MTKKQVKSFLCLEKYLKNNLKIKKKEKDELIFT
jgi:hypothetical protein